MMSLVFAALTTGSLLAGDAIAPAESVDIREYRQEDVLAQMVEARTVGELRKCYEARLWPDAAVEIVYSVRLREMKAPDADESLVRAIPASPVEFWYAYEVFTHHSSDRERKLAAAYWHYWEMVPTAILHRRSGFRAFLLLSRWAKSGEMMDQMQTANETLWNGNRRAVLRSLRFLDPETRAQICNKDGLPCEAIASKHSN